MSNIFLIISPLVETPPLKNTADDKLLLVEAQIGDYLGEGSIVLLGYEYRRH